MSDECPKCGHKEPEIEVVLPVGLTLIFSFLAFPFLPASAGAIGLMGGLIGFWIEYRRVRKEQKAG